MLIPEEFKDMRPFEPEELPAAYDQLLADPTFRKIATGLFPSMPFETLSATMRRCPTSQAFQETFCKPFLENLVKQHTHGLSSNFSQLPLAKGQESYTYISNHRDIVLDSGLLCVLLLEWHLSTVEIAIGDNLLIQPWIKTLVRVNRSFIVTRNASLRETLEASIRLSHYMHFAIAQKRVPIWIAQREGRAKDSNDLTQESILKMFVMGGEGTPLQRLQSLHLVPLAISYEYDPCDFLKAKEFQLKRDNADYKKSPADDLLNMQTGIFGYKGHVHYQAAACIDEALATLPADLPKNQFFQEAAHLIDRGIHRNYRLYPGNYVALDLLEGADTQTAHYSAEEKAQFLHYLEGQLAKIDLPQRDDTFLQTKMLEMYANPLRNFLAAEK